MAKQTDIQTKEIKVVTLFRNKGDNGYYYSTTKVAKVTIFGLEGGTCTTQKRGNKIDLNRAVWLNELGDKLDESKLPEEALYLPVDDNSGILARNKNELEQQILDLNQELADEQIIPIYK